MATYQINGPGGAVYEIDGPDDATDEQIQQLVSSIESPPEQKGGMELVEKSQGLTGGPDKYLDKATGEDVAFPGGMFEQRYKDGKFTGDVNRDAGLSAQAWESLVRNVYRLGSPFAKAASKVAELPGIKQALELPGKAGEKIGELIVGDDELDDSQGVVAKGLNYAMEGVTGQPQNATDRSTANLMGNIMFTPANASQALKYAKTVPKVGAAVKTAEKIGKTAIEAPNKIVGALAENITTIPEDALRKYGNKAGRESLEKAYGKQFETGQELVDLVFDGSNKIPETKIVASALKKAPPMNMQPVFDALENSMVKGGALTTAERKANSVIRKQLNSLKGGGSGTVYNVDANRYRKIRTGLDNDINWDALGAATGGIVDKAFRNARTVMKDELLNAVPDPKYKQAMESWSKKIDAVSDVKQYLGSKRKIAEDRAESFFSQVEGKNKTSRRRRLQELDNTFDTDFKTRAETMKQAEDLGRPNKEKLSVEALPKTATGNKWLAAVAFPVGSPYIAARGTLPLMEKIENASKGALRRLSKTDRVEKGVQSLAQSINGLQDQDEKRLIALVKLLASAPEAKKTAIEAKIEKLMNKKEEGN